MSKTLLSYISPQKDAEETAFTLKSPRSSYKIQVELFNCNRSLLHAVKKVICLHSAPHSVALFLKMKDSADLALYCHPLLAFKEEKDYVLAYTSKYEYPLAVLSVLDTLDNLFVRNGVPTHFRRWCTRIFKIQATKLFYRKMNPLCCRDPKSSQTYKFGLFN